MPDDAHLDHLRDELRRLWRAAPAARYELHPIDAAGTWHLFRVAPDGGRWLVAMPARHEAASFLVAAANAVATLFAALDARTGTVRVLGDVDAGGRIVWRGAPPAAA